MASVSVPVVAAATDKWKIIQRMVPDFDDLLSVPANTIKDLKKFEEKIQPDQMVYAKKESGLMFSYYIAECGSILDEPWVATDCEVQRMFRDYDTKREVILCTLMFSDEHPVFFCKIPYAKESKLEVYIPSKGVYVGVSRADMKIKRRHKCDRPECTIVGATKKCSKCKAVRYCSKTCQSADWPAHKKVCGDTVELD